MCTFASIGSGRWKAERFRSGAYRETKEVAERQSRLPTESGRICAFHQSGRAGAERSESSRSEVSAGRSRNGASVGPAGLPNASWDPCCSVNLPLRAAFADGLPYSIWSGDLVTFSCRRFRRAGRFPVRVSLVRHTGMDSRHLFFKQALSVVRQRMAGRIDLSGYVKDFSPIDNGAARRCWRFGWDVGEGSGAIPKGGGQGRRK